MASNDLFESIEDRQHEPLAARLRPETLDEFIGQEAIIGPGRLLRRAIESDRLSNLIFFGPPGTGKTTLAQIVAKTTQSKFLALNAVLSGVKELREAIEIAKKQQELYGRQTILFIDEVHRWSKSQQDALLPWTENGTIILIGATTENPYFEINRALLSRSRLFKLQSLTEEDLKKAAHFALTDVTRGYGTEQIVFEESALEHLITTAKGDCRTFYNALELAIESSRQDFKASEQPIVVTLACAEESIQKGALFYDKNRDYHYDVISAFIKSLRGSDADAALFWLAKMVASGEDTSFIWRRLLISASEDVGLADPQAIVVVQNCAAAFDRVGLPEGQYHLAEATLYLATAPKSNSLVAYFEALDSVKAAKQHYEVPNHLRDSHYNRGVFAGGKAYDYPHNYPGHWVKQQYLPTALAEKIFYRPSRQGYEQKIAQQVEARRAIQHHAWLDDPQLTNPLKVMSASSLADEELFYLMTERLNEETKLLMQTIVLKLDLSRHSVALLAGDHFQSFVKPLLATIPEGGLYIVTPKAEVAMKISQEVEPLELLYRPIISEERLKTFLASEASGQLHFDSALIVQAEDLSSLPQLQAKVTQLLFLFYGQGVLLSDHLDKLSGQALAILLEAEAILATKRHQKYYQSWFEGAKLNYVLETFTTEQTATIKKATIAKWLTCEAELGALIYQLAPSSYAEIIADILGCWQEKTLKWQREYYFITLKRV